MPTLGGDVQAVLADKKICFQYQEVAFVVASDRCAVAERVETESVLATLRGIGVDYAQGYAIARPASPVGVPQGLAATSPLAESGQVVFSAFG